MVNKAGGRRSRRTASSTTPSSGYTFIARGADGVMRCEHFSTAAEYFLRLATLEHTPEHGLSIDQIASLLDP
jgi:hypothetical protein